MAWQTEPAAASLEPSRLMCQKTGILKKQFQLESLLYSQHFWQAVDEVSGLNSGYRRSGRLQPLMDDAGVTLARRRKESAKDLWKNFASWEVISSSKEWQLSSPTGLWILIIFLL